MSSVVPDKPGHSAFMESIGSISFGKMQKYLLRRPEANIFVHAASNVGCMQSFDAVSNLIGWTFFHHAGKTQRNAF